MFISLHSPTHNSLVSVTNLISLENLAKTWSRSAWCPYKWHDCYGYRHLASAIPVTCAGCMRLFSSVVGILGTFLLTVFISTISSLVHNITFCGTVTYIYSLKYYMKFSSIYSKEPIYGPSNNLTSNVSTEWKWKKINLIKTILIETEWDRILESPSKSLDPQSKRAGG
jgi:hypothetical protein